MPKYKYLVLPKQLKIRFSGANVAPDKVSSNEFGKIVSAYENAIVSVVKKNHPNRTLPAYISVTGVDQNLLGIDLKPNLDNDIFEAADEINKNISNRTFNKLPINAVENLTVIQRFINEKKATAHLNGYEGISSTTITTDTNLNVDETFYIKGETTVYGKVVRIGGKSPKVRIEVDNKSISVIVSASVAKDLSSHLYDTVAITGIAKWKKEDHELVDLKFISHKKIIKKSLAEKIKDLKNIIGKQWDNVDDPDEYLSHIREDI